ncbi:MAG: DUF99 family protein [Euryarchaeota archaeon]|nr:DUF99 family protein [Euryarchaeota archaeon]
MRIKPEIRILGVDDGSIVGENVLVVGIVFRGGFWIDGVLSTHIKKDGLDATEKIIEMVKTTKHQDLRVIMFDGVTFGGFNTIDIQQISRKTGLPCVIVIRRMPDIDSIKKALTHLDHSERREKMIAKAGKIYKVEMKDDKELYYQFYGLERAEAEKLIRMSATHSSLPEPVRVAHMVATGIVRGEASRKP